MTMKMRQFVRTFHSLRSNHHHWSILKLQPEDKSKYACLVLNLHDNPDKFKNYINLWDEASLRVAVDGSANYLNRKQLINTAHVVCGDFDSIDQRLLERLRQSSVASNSGQTPQVVETPCQKETDFTKAIRVAVTKRSDITLFYALFQSDGSRLDHLFGLVNTLHLLKRNIILVDLSSNTISWILPAGSHTIRKQKGNQLCSLVPFTGPTIVRTQGLQYDVMPNQPMKFGGLISTSNSCSGEKITIETNHELLWSICLSD